MMSEWRREEIILEVANMPMIATAATTADRATAVQFAANIPGSKACSIIAGVTHISWRLGARNPGDQRNQNRDQNNE